MNIVLLESLGVNQGVIDQYVALLKERGHNFKAFDRSTDVNIQIEQAKDADILIIANMHLSKEVIYACNNLKYIVIAFTGVDHVDLEAAKERGIKVSNASGYSNESVAELTVCMMLILLRNIPEVEQRCRQGKTKDGLVGNELAGKTVGIIGCGAIGKRTAELCTAFGCKIIAYNGFSNKKSEGNIIYLPLKDLMEQSDIVTLHCPATEKSKNLINAESLSYMKKTAILINAARGAVVNSQDLADALNRGQIAGAGVDVFEVEPPLDTMHPLLQAKRCIVTPHIAFATQESMEARAKIVFDNIEEFLIGNHVNPIE